MRRNALFTTAVKVNVGFAAPGNRSPLGVYLTAQNKIVSEGLLGGTLFKSWSLLNLAENKAKLTMDGTKKINGVECYVLDYNPRGGSDSNVSLYFDAQTFRHLRTEYQRVISARVGVRPEDSSRQLETRQILTEDFSNFKAFDKLMLPQDYRMTLTNIGQNGNSEFQ